MIKGRTCSGCAMCCLVLQIDEELQKPRDQWCKHALPGNKQGACSIYETRPGTCKRFKCLWLEGWLQQDHWQPQKSRMVLFGATDDGTPVLKICVDGKLPNRWREEPYFGQIKAMSVAGLNRQPKQLTVVFVNADKYLVLGDNLVKNPGNQGHLVQTGPDTWDFVGPGAASRVAESQNNAPTGILMDLGR